MLLQIHSWFKALVGSVDLRFALREKGAFQMFKDDAVLY